MANEKDAGNLDRKAQQTLSLAEEQRLADDADRARLQKAPRAVANAFPFFRN